MNSKILIFITLLLSISYSSVLECEYFRINDSLAIVRSKWGVYGALGIAYHIGRSQPKLPVSLIQNDRQSQVI
jgi:hypothetical protein